MPEKWGEVLDKMIYAFQLSFDSDIDGHEAEFDEGMKLFTEYFNYLWW